MKKKKFLGDKIQSDRSSWTFKNSNIVNKFENHIGKSIPMYNDVHQLICDLSLFFLNEKSKVLDIGCSTGSLLNQINKINPNKLTKYTGIDHSKDMIKFAKKKYKNRNINFIHKSVKDYKFEKYDLILSIYTIQFIKPEYRQLIFDKIYKNLNWGGAFLVFEKIRGPDARFQDIYNSTYNEFKLQNGFMPEEIFNKTRSLFGILEPFSDKGNLELIKRAGFKDIATVFHWINFKGYLCIK